MHILVAPNAFKNAVSAEEAAAAIQCGLARSRLLATTGVFPVGDGGDGTGDLLIRHLGGEKIRAMARDPFGQKIATHWGLVPPRVAIVEMANASGLRLLDPAARDPLRSSSAGTGDLIRAALDREVDTILLGMGGSATVDGGTGILESLGFRFLDSRGERLNRLPADLQALDSIDSSHIHPRLASTKLVILCDVINPPTGPQGAAAIFGPQKGASQSAIRSLEAGLERLAVVIRRQTGKDVAVLARGGTAGGAAAGLNGLLAADLVSGIDYFLTITHFDAALEQSSVVITGEGSIDGQTLEGKAPYGVALRARARGIPVIAFCGNHPADPVALQSCFDEIVPINPTSFDLAEALAATAERLERAAMEWANRLASGGPGPNGLRMVSVR